MYTAGMTAAEKKAYEALLITHHSVETELWVMDMDHNPLSRISNRLIDGQVTVDASGDISRGASVDLFDPGHALHLDSKSPDAGAVFADRMLAIRHSIINPQGTLRYTVPLFTGPITKLSRSDAVVSIEALGKETLSLARVRNQKTYKAGLYTVDVIRSILAAQGESKFSIPDGTAKITRNVSVGGADFLPWTVAKKLATALDYHLYYNGMGIATLRKLPSSPAYTFRSRESIKTPPEAGFDIDGMINQVEIFGRQPDPPQPGQTQQKRPYALVTADRNHPLSPWSLARNGVPRFLPEVYEEDNILTDSAAKVLATSRLNSRIAESVDVKFNSLVIPHLEEMDIVRVSTEEFASNFRLQKFAIPLTAAGEMSVGYVKKVRPIPRATRTR